MDDGRNMSAESRKERLEFLQAKLKEGMKRHKASSLAEYADFINIPVVILHRIQWGKGFPSDPRIQNRIIDYASK
jgi:hypothetical protein